MFDSFSVKTIQIAVTIGGNIQIIEGLACEVTVEKPGLPEKNSAAVKIWGLDRNRMKELTTLSFRPLEMGYNPISIKAGELGKDGKQPALSLVFQGEITFAAADFSGAPDPCMDIEAVCGSYPQLMAAPVHTTKGAATADSLFAQWSKEAGYTYRNEGVTSSVQNAWFPGSPIDKMMKLARDIRCELLIDDGVVIVLPPGKVRSGNAVFLSKATGLIGYPTFNQDGIVCKCIYNPDLIHGGLIEVESIVPHATEAWKITKLTHNLSAYVPGGGNWESQIEAVLNER